MVPDMNQPLRGQFDSDDSDFLPSKTPGVSKGKSGPTDRTPKKQSAPTGKSSTDPAGTVFAGVGPELLKKVTLVLVKSPLLLEASQIADLLVTVQRGSIKVF